MGQSEPNRAAAPHPTSVLEVFPGYMACTKFFIGGVLQCADESSERNAMSLRRHYRESSMIDVRERLEPSAGVSGTYHTLPLLEQRGAAKVLRLPVSLP